MNHIFDPVHAQLNQSSRQIVSEHAKPRMRTDPKQTLKAQSSGKSQLRGKGYIYTTCVHIALQIDSSCV